jgi:outer membrane immunogenic protein
MKKRFGRAIALALLAAVVTPFAGAQAADMAVKAPSPPPAPLPAWSWTGLYVGINGGGASGHSDFTYTTAPFAASPQSQHGDLFGATLGANWQFSGNAVVGVEADWDGAWINGSAPCPTATYSCQSAIRDFGTVRGRLGWAWDHVLFYGTGGFAWGDVRIQTVLPGVPEPPSGTPTNGQQQSPTGYAAGAGIEYAFWQGASIKVEWLHYELRNSNPYAVDNGLFVNANQQGDMIRGGLNWRFISAK